MRELLYLRLLDPVIPLVVVDEVQKIPEVLDEVHWCIENQSRLFTLCGSIVRKLKRGHTNFLGGFQQYASNLSKHVIF